MINEKINSSELSELYILINNEICKLFKKNESPNKHIKFVDIEYSESAVKAFVRIGTTQTQKSANSAKELEYFWTNETPYNSQSNNQWSYSSSFGYSEMDATIENDNKMPVLPSGYYWSDVKKTGPRERLEAYDPFFDTMVNIDYYWIDGDYNIPSDICGPEEESSFWPWYTAYKDIFHTKWTTLSGIGMYAGYRRMNKYYNCVKGFIDFYHRNAISKSAEPNYKREPFSFDITIVNEITHTNNKDYLRIDGYIDISYAVRKRKYALPGDDEQIPNAIDPVEL